jgi:hypothetical protein
MENFEVGRAHNEIVVGPYLIVVLRAGPSIHSTPVICI